jgi:RNA polymerase sigma-70 factor (ECF subfamily)
LLKEVTYSESELLQGLQAHDENAFSFLYENYSRALFGIILQIIPQQELAEDVLQEVFVKIWQNINSYDISKGRLYTWMLNIARNQAIDRTRSKDFNNRGKTIELSDNVYTNKQSVDAKFDDVGLKKTLGNLPEESRKLLEMAYYQGYTQEEISRILNIPLGTVKTRIRSTIIQLRKILSTP